ncbi:PREDICTED: NHS-like protein 1 isoform X2 [Chinchilla lanigera]|uniref:NHS like 1 n=1 Tax=Chinchilla lanigera TaxID=34839 RepID=A0A8C2VJL1_CHILA|nr:PREDICTED: NHS-like protein 1 isoform X2 [Chinchilla lanigera]
MGKKMKKEGSSGSFRLKANAGSLSRAVSWINFSSLSRQTKRLFRSDGELSVCGQQVDADEENWIYRTQPRKAVSNLDEESRWTVHYTAPWHQQENVFLPSTRPPCVEDLHRQAKLNLKSVLRDCDKLRRDGYRSSQYYSQGPTFAAHPGPLCDECQHEDADTDQKCSVSSSEDERHIGIRRPKTPTSGDFSDLNTQTNWTKSLPLPTPEEKMRQQAQTVQADVVPINVTASATGQDEAGGYSGYPPDHYSPRGRLDSYHSAGQRSETRDSSCQTEDVRVVPPSMRRIRAHKGLGIAAQMSPFSGSSSNMSVLSDPAGLAFPSHLHSEPGFHSLPRSGVRANAHSLGTLGPAEDVDDPFPYSQGDDNLGHLGGAGRSGTFLRPKSQELRHFDSENSMTSPACMVSPHASFSTSIIPNATLSSSSDVIILHTAQSAGQLDSRMASSSAYSRMKPRDHLLSRHGIRADHASPGHHWSDGHSSIYSQPFDSPSPSVTTLLSACDPEVTPNGPQAMHYNCRNTLSFPAHPQDVDGKSESSSSGSRGQGGVEPWEYRASSSGRASPLKPHLAAPGYSTPTSNQSSCSLDQTPIKEDAGSLYSEDHAGCYRSAHSDSGCGFGNPRHSVVNVFDGRVQKGQGGQSGYHDKSLSRNFSLKKAKKPPLPPCRTDSLRRIPKKSGQSNGQVLNESLIATLQQSLQLSLPGKGGSSASQSPCSDFEEPWLSRSRSQSTVSAGSSMTSATTPNVYSLSGVTPSQSDSSSIRSECTDPWGYYIDYTGVREEPGNPAGRCSASGGAPTGNGPVRHIQEASRATVPQVPGGCTKPKVTSPEKSQRVTSPSSGYSSQSNTPTALTPVPVFLKSVSPANGKGKAKPKVPERKSSLISSVSMSSSSTSLSSNTSTEGSGTVKKLDAAPALPLAPPPPTPPLLALGPADKAPLLPVLPTAVDGTEGSPLPHSPVFPPPPPEVLPFFCSPPDGCLPSAPTALSPFIPDALASSPAPPPFPPSLEPPPAPPLDPTFMKVTRPSCRISGQPQSSWEALRPPSNKEESARRPMPLITTEALQMVQLRPVRKGSGAEVAPSPEPTAQEQRTPTAPQYHLKPSALLKSRNSINEMESESQPASATSSLPTPAKSPSQGDRDSAAERAGLVSRSHGAPCPGPGTEEAESGPGLRSTPLPDTSPSRKPPPLSKKPKLFLVVPPPQRDFATENVSEAFQAVPSPTRAEERAVHSEEAKECSAARAGSHATDPGSSVLDGGAAGFGSPSRVEADAPMVQPNASPAPTQEEPAGDGGGDAGCCPSQQDGEAGVQEAHTAEPSAEACDFFHKDDSEEVTTPTRPRTTEDLFAAIHRSKRKVLGRKDSEDDHSRNHSPSPPVTPTGTAPSLASPKQVGSIQRSVRKSSTSSDNFKALLLKKGSRSDTSARMSAAEMLRHTDPRFQRSRSEPAPDAPESPSSCSPSKSRRAQEEWARSEGPMPRSLSFSGPRYGRSRTPPSAASSRYSVRNRIQSSPMTVISEGEGEAVEPADPRVRRAKPSAQDRGDQGGEATDASLPPRTPGPAEEGEDPSTPLGGAGQEQN